MIGEHACEALLARRQDSSFFSIGVDFAVFFFVFMLLLNGIRIFGNITLSSRCLNDWLARLNSTRGTISQGFRKDAANLNIHLSLRISLNLLLLVL